MFLPLIFLQILMLSFPYKGFVVVNNARINTDKYSASILTTRNCDVINMQQFEQRYEKSMKMSIFILFVYSVKVLPQLSPTLDNNGQFHTFQVPYCQ